MDKYLVGNAVKIKPQWVFDRDINSIWIIKEASLKDDMVTVRLYKELEFRKFKMTKLFVDNDCIKINRKNRLEKLKKISDET